MALPTEKTPEQRIGYYSNVVATKTQDMVRIGSTVDYIKSIIDVSSGESQEQASTLSSGNMLPGEHTVSTTLTTLYSRALDVLEAYEKIIGVKNDEIERNYQAAQDYINELNHHLLQAFTDKGFVLAGKDMNIITLLNKVLEETPGLKKVVQIPAASA